MKRVVLCLLVLIACGADKERQAPAFKVGPIRVEIDRRLQDDWEFFNFDVVKGVVDVTVEGVAYHRGGGPDLYRWYAYDKDDVKIEEGPLAYQDYPRGEKTRFEMILGDKAPLVRRIKIVAR
jgi:hypothetical protein